MSLCERERERMMMMYLCKGVHFPPSRLKFYPWDHQFALLMFTQKTVCVWLFLRVKTLWNISVAHAFRRQLIHHRVKDVDRETLKNHTFLCLLYSWGWLNEVSSPRQGCIFLITNLHWRCSKHSKHFNCIVSTANAAHVQQAHQGTSHWTITGSTVWISKAQITFQKHKISGTEAIFAPLLVWACTTQDSNPWPERFRLAEVSFQCENKLAKALLSMLTD